LRILSELMNHCQGGDTW